MQRNGVFPIESNLCPTEKGTLDRAARTVSLGSTDTCRKASWSLERDTCVLPPHFKQCQKAGKKDRQEGNLPHNQTNRPVPALNSWRLIREGRFTFVRNSATLTCLDHGRNQQ